MFSGEPRLTRDQQAMARAVDRCYGGVTVRGVLRESVRFCLRESEAHKRFGRSRCRALMYDALVDLYRMSLIRLTPSGPSDAALEAVADALLMSRDLEPVMLYIVRPVGFPGTVDDLREACPE